MPLNGLRQIRSLDRISGQYGVVVGARVLICDRDRKWSGAVQDLLQASEIRVVRTPFHAPNANAHAERFVRSIKNECLSRMILFGERRLRRALDEFVEHDHLERTITASAMN